MAGKKNSPRRLRVEPTRKRIRATLGGALALDSVAVRLVWEHPYYPQYYVPSSDVIAGLTPAGSWEPPRGLGTAERFDVASTTGRVAEGAAWTYPGIPELADLVRFEWDAFEAWFEEDEPVTVHPRSPYVRIDALHSSRDIRIDVRGTTVAHSTRSVILFETGLSPRYYLPATDVRLDVLRPSSTRSRCPYKGEAEYMSVEIEETLHEDIAWAYRTPLREAMPIAGMVAFHDERCELYVDGVRAENGQA